MQAILLAYNRNVKIHAQVPVVRMQSAMFKIIHLYAHVYKDTLVIHLLLVTLFQYNVRTRKLAKYHLFTWFLLDDQPPSDPCNPSPCGSNAVCSNGVCSCNPNYHGDPYAGCRPECVLSNDCPRDKACIKNRCVDPCPGTCGHNAVCTVSNHIPMCSCNRGFTGNAFVICSPIPGTL